MKSKWMFIGLLSLGLGACTPQQEKTIQKPYKPGEVMVARISSDGNYVVTGGDQNSILLWHIPTRSYQVISKDGNGFSPYFIKNSDEFLWQSNKDNMIHIQTIAGKKVMEIPAKHRIYSDVMTSDKRYFFMSDFKWLKYRYDTQAKKWKRFSVSAFGADQKPLNMMLSSNDRQLLTSGTCYEKWDSIPLNKPKGKWNLDCVVLWNVDKARPVKKFWGWSDTTYATISPDGKVLIGGDNNLNIRIYSITSRKLLSDLDNIYFGKNISTGWDRDGIKKPPKDFVAWDGSNGSETAQAITYLTSTSYVTVNQGTTYAILYYDLNRKPTKYLPLGKMPWPSTYDPSRSGAIDSLVNKHILVTGQASFDGINVYKFAPKTETLYRVWSPILNKPPTAPKTLSKDVPTLPGITFDQLSEVKHIDGYPKK